MSDSTPVTALTRRAGEPDQTYPHIEVPFTLADREMLMEIRDTLCGFQILIENFDTDALVAKLFGGGDANSAGPMDRILGALVR